MAIQGKDLFDKANVNTNSRITINSLKKLLRDRNAKAEKELQYYYSVLLDEDDRLYGALMKRINAVSGLDYKFTGDNAESLWELFNQQVDFNDLVSKLMMGVAYGYVLIQLIFERIEGRNHISSLQMRPNWVFLVNEAGDIAIDDGGTGNGIKLDPKQWIVHKHNAIDSNLYSASIIRKLSKTLTYKTLAVQDRDMYLSLYGIKPLIGYIPAHKVGDDVYENSVFSFLGKLKSGTHATISEDVRIEQLKSVEGDVSIFDNYIEYADKQIDFVINGGSVSDTTSGSRALGETIDKTRLELVNDDARQIVDTINRQFLPIWLTNLGLSSAIKLEIVSDTVTADKGTKQDIVTP